MELGIAFKGDLSMERTVAIAQRAEAAGFDYVWFFDSHVLWSDPYTRMAVCMDRTERVRFGPLVTNPKAREWSVAGSIYATLSEISGGRFDLAVGRGDSSMRVMGRTPATLDKTVEFCRAMQAFVRGDTVEYADSLVPVYLEWAPGHELPIWFAAYGPKALATAGRHADGLVVQLADPGLTRWFAEQSLAAGREAGRDMSGYRVLACAPVWVGDRAEGIERTRWFPALVGNHVADIVEQYGKDTDLVPRSLTEYIEGRRGVGADEGYDYRQHVEVESDNTYYVGDDVTESFCIIGPVEQHVAKLRALEEAGATQFAIYLTGGDEERIVEEYARHVIPALRG
ncbi:MAG: TIGR03842 family LLM class F420-dependent oxidoreductase [Thermoleophilia bacterium]